MEPILKRSTLYFKKKDMHYNTTIYLTVFLHRFNKVIIYTFYFIWMEKSSLLEAMVILSFEKAEESQKVGEPQRCVCR